MKCLSIKQPWAELILRGIKDVENRNVRFHHTGQLLIHTGQRIDNLAWRVLTKRHGFAFNGGLPTGAIVGIVTVTSGKYFPIGAKRKGGDFSKWHEEGFFGLYMEEPRRFETPVPYSGQLGLFDVPAEKVREELQRLMFEEAK